MCVTEGGGTGASTRNRRSILARFGVLWYPTPPETNHKPKTATASRIHGFDSASLESRVFSGCGTFGGGVMSAPKPRSVRRCPGS